MLNDECTLSRIEEFDNARRVNCRWTKGELQAARWPRNRRLGRGEVGTGPNGQRILPLGLAWLERRLLREESMLCTRQSIPCLQRSNLQQLVS
jgi:hypothetical protein